MKTVSCITHARQRRFEPIRALDFPQIPQSMVSEHFIEQRRTHGSQFTKTLRPRSICPSCRHIQCFFRHSLSLPLDCHKFIWEIRFRCNSVFEEEFSSNSSKFPQIQEHFLKLKLLRKCSHTPPLFRQTRTKPPSVDYGMFF